MKRTKHEDVARFIAKNIDNRNIANRVAENFRLTRQTANHHIRKMVENHLIEGEGQTKSRTYKPVYTTILDTTFAETDNVEHKVWVDHVEKEITHLPENLRFILSYAFTEMLNNAFDHSNATEIRATVMRSISDILITVKDNGVGIFRKIQSAYSLDHPRESILEISKGKLTTDPDNHSGEGIFFTSRVMDRFAIQSGELSFFHKTDDWLIEDLDTGIRGTEITMSISVFSTTEINELFNQFAGDDFGFDKTRVPVKLAQHEGGFLVSRSQAKRLLARFDRFSEVLLDFSGVTQIGQAFADEIFRVYRLSHPDTPIHYVHAVSAVEAMIIRALRR